MLETIDWVILIAYLAISIYIGFHFKNQAGKSLSDFFLGGRNMPWYVAGISMVATTFAADTPLWVTEVVAQNGISGNWLWWNMLIGGMLTTFFFSKLWRRANVLTELEFIELRYGGKPAKFLRGFKAAYMGLFLNVIIIGWVNFALMTILNIFFDIPAYDNSIPFYENEILWYIGGAMVLVAIYSSLSGLKGVAITDTLQFFIAMIGCIVMAWFVLDTPEIGGIAGLKEKLPAWRFSFFPKLETGTISEGVGVFGISISAFLTFAMVQWWASWYPGAEPGGGGYVAQRMMSTKTEKDSLFATLFFQIAHYCLRPWPWIIVALCSLVLYPDLPIDEAGKGFVLVMRDYLPAGLKGLLLVAFLSAYMSTISTQLNWGSSFLTNDLYKRFYKNEDAFKDEESAQKHYVSIARWFTVLIMVVAFYTTTQISTIDAAAKFLIQAGAGLGMVLILRWYWWRINAWSEIAASIAPIFGYIIANNFLNLPEPFNFLFTVGFSSVIWLTVTFLTKPEIEKVLTHFCDRVSPPGAWANFTIQKDKNEPVGGLVLTWLMAVVMTYGALFTMGYFLFNEWYQFGIALVITLISGFIVVRSVRTSSAF
ncbi:MAG: sodium:solute symporter family protein [Salibacteraceae bacterium]